MKKLVLWRSWGSFSIALGCLFALIFHDSILAHPIKSKVPQYGLFEAEFQAQLSYNNPYVEAFLSVSVDGPNGIHLEIEGYWYEGNCWRFRIMPTAPGRWIYITHSNDPGLDSLSGEFECVPSDRPGILQVNPDFPYSFRLSEGTPFLWLGETNWCLMSDGVPFSDGSFQKYIIRRREQKFNGIHFVLGTGGLPLGTTNPKNEGGSLWISQSQQRINPEFYKWMDRRMAFLDSVQMAVGFFITWAQHFMTFRREQFERWERYLIARYAAYPLLYWVLVGEFDEAGTIEDYHYHGRVFYNFDPYGHLISNHPNHWDPNNLGTSRIFAGQDWFGMVLQQLPRYPITATPAEVNRSILVDRQYNIPVVNLEFGYEDKNYYGKIVTAQCIRKYAWAIMFGGGFLSYGHEKTIRTVDPSALESEGVRYLGIMYEFFERLKWWEFSPDPDRADRGFCLSSPRPEFLVYLVEPGPVKVDLSQVNGLFMANWFDPITGDSGDTLLFSGGRGQTFDPPFANDAILHIFPNCQPIMEVTPDRLLFEAVEHGDNPEARTIRIRNIGAGEMKWSATKLANSEWLLINPSTGIGDADVSVSIELNGLSPVIYRDTVQFSAYRAMNGPIAVPIELKVDSMACMKVISPNGGEYWEIGSQQQITWWSQRISDTVRIHYSSDAGSSWHQIARAPNIHHYTWTVPAVPSSNCLIRISDEISRMEDQSDSTFCIAEPLQPDFSAEPLIGYLPLNVTFHDHSTGLIDRWHWDFGDGGISKEQHPVHSYLISGCFSVQLTIAGKTGERSAIKSNYITVLERNASNVDGNVKYFNQCQPVSDVTLELVHENGKWQASTSSSGYYLFEAIPHGYISICANKPGKSHGAVKGSDVVLVLRYLAGLQKLSEDQKIAADVTRDSSITELDARSMLSYLCFDAERAAHTDSWRFRPDACHFIHRSDTTIHWCAVVLGDVNGDWQNDQEENFIAGSADISAVSKQTQLKIGTIAWRDQGQASVPILIAGLSEPLQSLMLTVEYPPSMLKFKTVQSGSLWGKFLVESNGKFDGKIHIAMAAAAGCKSEGEILRIILDSKEQNICIDETDFLITRAIMNDHTIITLTNAILDAKRSGKPEENLVLRSEPNPFHGQTRIQFALPKAMKVELNIYNILGQRVRTLISGNHPAGLHELFWDGTDEQGRDLKSGVYLYQLRNLEPGQPFQCTKKMFLLR